MNNLDHPSSTDQNQSFNLDEIEDLISEEKQISNEIPKILSTQLSSNTNRPMENKTVLKSKTSNIPGPVGLLPILKSNEDLKRIKDDKSTRDTFLTNEETHRVKRPKRSADLFSLNIENYPSYSIALRQLNESFSCEPISIQTALIKARLGIKKRIPLMCTAVTHYDRHENTVLLDKSGHIRASFIGDDESLDNYNIRVGHTLILRNVAVFTSIRHRHHYVNIHLQNLIAIQDPLSDVFTMPLISQELQTQKSMLCQIEEEISAYEDTSKVHNETFQIFSQSDLNDDEQNRKNSNRAAFSKVNSASNKFKETTNSKISAPPKTIVHSNCSEQKTKSTIPTSSSLIEVNKSVDTESNNEAMKNLMSDIDDEFFTSW